MNREFRAAFTARFWFYYSTIPNRIVYCIARPSLLGVAFSVFCYPLVAYPVTPFSVIFPIIINALLAVFANVQLSALFALSKVTVRHHRVFIEFSEGLFSPALKACFYRGCHAAT